MGTAGAMRMEYNMNSIALGIGIFFALSFMASILAIAVCVMSSQISRQYDLPEEAEVYASRQSVTQEDRFLKKSSPA